MLNRLRKHKQIVVLSADKEPIMVILNKTDYVNKVNPMIDEGISKDKYVETVDTTHKDNISKIFFIDIFTGRYIMIVCVPFLISLHIFLPLLKCKNSIIVKILMLNIWNWDPL